MSTLAASGLSAMRFLWNYYDDKHYFPSAKREMWVDEFFFCLLGGYSIPYELNKSAYIILKDKGYFRKDMYFDDDSLLIDKLERELSTHQFFPLRKDGDYRSYRFPNAKAKTIVMAGQWLIQACDFKIENLFTEDTKNDRENLVRCPGFGYKTASWYLRNIGHGHNLAIIDVHVCRALKDFMIIPRSLDPYADYLEIEAVFCEACSQIGASVDAMDLIIWEWARGDGYVRTQYHSAI